MARTKNRIADLDAKIEADAGDVDQLEQLRLATSRLRELAAAIRPELANADWQRRREIIRTLVRRIDIDTEVIRIFSVQPRTPEARVLTLLRSHCRGPKRFGHSADAFWFGRLGLKIVVLD